MSRISRQKAIELFEPCDNIIELIETIKKNCHLWFDENCTIATLNRCYLDVRRSGSIRFFSTVLIDDEGRPYDITFAIAPNESVQLLEK